MTVSSRTVALTGIVALLLCSLVDAFSTCPRHHASGGTTPTALYATQRDNNNNNGKSSLSRKSFVSIVALSLGTLFVNGQSALADDEKSITACKIVGGGKPTNCVSTASVRQVDCYAPPWTFEVSADEAMARLKGVIASDPSLELVEEVSPSYLKVTSNRGPLDATDEIQFLVNTQDKVVTFKSFEIGEPSVSDFGANRKRLEGLRKRAGVFGVMGDGLTADSYGNRGTGPLQQLKAFYGLQSGGGYEEIFEDD